MSAQALAGFERPYDSLGPKGALLGGKIQEVYVAVGIAIEPKQACSSGDRRRRHGFYSRTCHAGFKGRRHAILAIECA
jgi:hypothetical protein